MWKKIVLSSYIILMVSSVLGIVFGVLQWEDNPLLHTLLIEVSGLLFIVATILQFKLMEIRKTDTRIYELEEENKNLRTARKVDKEEFAKMEQKLQTIISTRFSGLDFSSEKDFPPYIEPQKSLLADTKTKLLSFLKK